MVRQTLSVILGWLAERLCTEHIPMAGTWPIYCARCWAIIPEDEEPR